MIFARYANEDQVQALIQEPGSSTLGDSYVGISETFGCRLLDANLAEVLQWSGVLPGMIQIPAHVKAREIQQCLQKLSDES